MDVPNLSFQGFYHQEAIKFMSDVCGQELRSTFVDNSKDSIDPLNSKPPRPPPDVFAKVHLIPDPVPGHYKKFKDVNGTQMTEKHPKPFEK